MKVALFLHAYQPPSQFVDVTDAIATRSYLPLAELLIKYPNSRVTMNIAGSLTEQLKLASRQDVLEKWRYLTTSYQIELVGSAAFHPLLTMLPDHEIVRQAQIQEYLNTELAPKEEESANIRSGFFLPEMVYERRVAEVISQLGYKWTLLDESAFPGASVAQVSNVEHFRLKIGRLLYQIAGLPLYVFFRNRPISLKLAFQPQYQVDELIADLKQAYILGQEQYVVLAVDAETFGHHNSYNLVLLEEMMKHAEIEMVGVSELISIINETEQIEPLRSTWGVTLENRDQKRTFPRWDNPKNPVHQLQWQLFNLAVAVGQHQNEIPDQLDRAVHSDQFWWASHNPCWHPDLVTRGAEMLVEVVVDSAIASKEQKELAAKLREMIETTGKQLYGNIPVNC